MADEVRRLDLLEATDWARLPGIEAFALSNGVRVVAEAMPAVRSVAIGLWVLAGSRHEPEALQGVSHFVEHLMFKGTERRSAREIAEAMDAVGGQLNAFTSKEYTCFHARVLDEHLPLAVDVIADMLLASLLRAEDIERERGVIQEEIGHYEDTPDELVHDLFAQAMWPNHPLGRSVLGTRASIAQLGREDILRYLRSAYAAANTVIAVAGNFNPGELRELLERQFGSWRGGGSSREDAVPQSGRSTALRSKDAELLHVCLGGEGLPVGHKDIYALSVLSNILGGGPSSRLFQEIREERGLAYSVFAYTASYRDSGAFVIYCGAGPERIQAALRVLGGELRKICRSGVDARELSRAKEQFKSNITMALESSGARMNRIGRAVLLSGKAISIDQVLERIDRIELADISRLASQFCDPERLTLAAIGPDPDRHDLRGAITG